MFFAMMGRGIRIKAPMSSEQSRLEAVRRYQVLDTPPDGAFDRITRLAARIFNVPIAIVSIVDEDRIWFKSKHGLEVDELPRAPGLCASAIMGDDPWLLTDAAQDPRALTNPLVAGDFGLRFYLGIPLRTSDNFNLGTLCIIDRQPRTVTPEQITSLQELAAIVVDELEVRLSARDAVEYQRMLVKEVHHRVRNNLQVVNSLLHLQQRACPPEATHALQRTAHRVQAIALLHHEFHSGNHVHSMNITSHLRRLAELSIESLGASKRVSLTVEGEDCFVTFDEATPLSLAVAEMISNCCEHAFRGDANGCVRITIKRHGDHLRLLVSDDGFGFQPDVNSSGMGLLLIKNLVAQMKGELTQVPQGQGTGYRLVVPLHA